MREMLAHLELLRVQIAECERLQQAAKSELKRDVYTRVFSRYRAIAAELEQAIAKLPPTQEPRVGRKARYAFPEEEK